MGWGAGNIGSGGGKLFAAIGVKYPEGSVCTCVNDETGKTFKAKSTSGQWIFSIPYVGTWTVSCTDGTDTASQVVEITAEGQSVDVKLTYDIWLYKNGNEYDEITGGWRATSTDTAYQNTGTVTKNENSIYISNVGNGSYGVATVNEIDLSLFSTIEMEGYRHPNSTDVISLKVATGFPTSSLVCSKIVNVETPGAFSSNPDAPSVISLDISDVAGLYRIAVQGPVSGAWVLSIKLKRGAV